MSALVSESFLKASSRSGSHSSWQTQTRRFLCVTRNPVHFGFFFSLSLSSITVLPGICSTSCYAVVCEEAAFPSLDPGSGQHVDLILGRDLLAPKVVLRAIRLQLSTLSFVLKPFLSICSHFCHEPLRRFTAGIFMENVKLKWNLNCFLWYLYACAVFCNAHKDRWDCEVFRCVRAFPEWAKLACFVILWGFFPRFMYRLTLYLDIHLDYLLFFIFSLCFKA